MSAAAVSRETKRSAGDDAAALVVARLDEAGATLMALPHAGFSTAARGYWPDMLRDSFIDMPSAERARPVTPDAARISRMEETFGWLAFIPASDAALRRVVGYRALINPLTDRHVFPWRRVGKRVGADYRAVQRWHAKAIGIIVAALAARGFIFGS